MNPTLDSYVRGYHIRRLDNRVRVVISAHCGMEESSAQATMRLMYADAEDLLRRYAPEWFSTNFPRKKK